MMLHSLECLFGAASLAFRAVLEAGLLNYQETVGSERQPPPHPLPPPGSSIETVHHLRCWKDGLSLPSYMLGYR